MSINIDLNRDEINTLIDVLRDKAYREVIQLNIQSPFLIKTYRDNQYDKITKLENLKEKLEKADEYRSMSM